MPYLSASAVVIHYEEALYQVYAPLPFNVIIRQTRLISEAFKKLSEAVQASDVNKATRPRPEHVRPRTLSCVQGRPVARLFARGGSSVPFPFPFPSPPLSSPSPLLPSFPLPFLPSPSLPLPSLLLITDRGPEGAL